MSNSFSLGSLEAKNRIGSDATFLVALEVEVRPLDTGSVVETLYLVSNNEDRTLGGVLYTAFPFKVDFKYEAGTQANITVTARDIARDLQQRMQQYNGGVGFGVRLKIFHQDAANDDPDFEEYFQVISASSQDYTVTWNLGSENLVDRKFPGRRQLRRCGWVYKSPECRYSGGLASCDYTLEGANGCRAHNNAINFGGYSAIKSYG